MGFKYTPDQQKVINLEDRNILVAAAAGSGKTAVLVERIIRIITDTKTNIDIDKLLVVTFTNAAAAQMKERIAAAIDRCLEENPTNKHLQKQANLIYNAQITTISSFCLSIIRNHFQDIGLDPNFRVGDEGEVKLIKKEALSEILEEKFNEESERFINFVETLSANGKETQLEDWIMKLYENSQSQPFPKVWLESCKDGYDSSKIEDIFSQNWTQFFGEYTKNTLIACKDKCDELLEICNLSSGPYMYVDNIEDDRAQIEEVIANYSYDYVNENRIVFGTLKSKRDDSVDINAREYVKGGRNEIKSLINDLYKKYYTVSLMDSLDLLKDIVDELVDCTNSFAERFALKKQEKAIIDFNDIEHFALDILVELDDGKVVATKTGEIYQEYYHEIMIDEYQDSNLVQEFLLRSISKESSNRNNRFMVGDVKQSIYKFRLARPEIFMEKYDTYITEDSNTQKIDLHKNFRSRDEVIDTVNHIFRQIMRKEIGGIIYDDDAALVKGATYSDLNEGNAESELLLACCGESDTDSKRLEAKMVADKIHDLTRNFYVTDSGTQGKRLASFKDIVILLRSNKGWDDIFKEVLETQGIPTHTESKTGYFTAYEVQIIMNYLAILDNPLQDIELCSVLVSAAFGFSENDLSMIRQGNYSGDYLYEKILAFSEDDEADDIIKNKVCGFIDMYNMHSELVIFSTISELIQRILEDTGLMMYLGTMPLGDRRIANVRMLIEKATNFEKTSYKGLFNFVRYMKQIKKYEVDYGESNTLDENANVVRIISIHKSKGLEFPICIVAGMGKGINQMDTRANLVIDVDYGIAMDHIDLQKRTKTKMVRKNIISKKIMLDNLGEELRILYVALTRAKEKLVMTAAIKSKEEQIFSASGMGDSTDMVRYMNIEKAKSYLDLVLLSYIDGSEEDSLITGENCEVIKKDTLTIKIMDEIALSTNEMINNIDTRMKKEELLKKSEGQVNRDFENIIKNNLEYLYEYEDLNKIQSKISVTELKRRYMQEEGEEDNNLYKKRRERDIRPRFIEEKKANNTTRGNAYHRLFEVIDIEDEDVEAQIERLLRDRSITQEYRSYIEVDSVKGFFETQLRKRMAKANSDDKLWREHPFVMEISASEVDEDWPKDEVLLLQGIIDAYFEEDGEIVVVDYKSDRVESEEELVEKYKIQLDYYAKVLEQLTKKRVKEKYIFSIKFNKAISL